MAKFSIPLQCAVEWMLASVTIQPLLPASWTKLSAHTIKMYFGAITFTSWFRLECFAVYASSPLLPPEMQDSLRRGLAIPFYRGTYTLKISAALPSAPTIPLTKPISP